MKTLTYLFGEFNFTKLLVSCLVVFSLVLNANAQWVDGGSYIHSNNHTVQITSAIPELTFFDSSTGDNRVEGRIFENLNAMYFESFWGSMYFRTDATGGSPVADMTIDGNSGHVGIGTIAPQEKLTVSGAIKLSSTANTNVGTIRWNGTNFQGYKTGGWVNFESPWVASGASNVYETDEVGIGAAPSAKLHVTQSTNTSLAAGYKLSTSLGTNEDWYFYMDANDDFTFKNDASTLPAIHLQKNTNNVGIKTSNPLHDLHVAGDVAVAGSIIHPSDKNLKENIETINNGLSIINQLNATTYNHKTDKAEEFGLSTKPQYGLIAQEVEEVLPEIVVQKALVGEDGEIYKGLDYEKLIPILVQALQESDAKVERLTSHISRLTSQNQQQTTINKQLLDFMDSQQSRTLSGTK